MGRVVAVSNETHNEFDFPSFACCLTDDPWTMSERVGEEIKNVSSISTGDPVRKFKQLAYLKQLQRLGIFLQSGELPKGMTPEEQKGYDLLRECSIWVD